MGLINFLFNGESRRNMRRMEKMAAQVEALEPKYAAMTDAELRAQTGALKERLAGGETLDAILYDAFAVVREAAWRVLKLKHYHVQIIGGICLHQGRIAEMKTGEGKTLVATLPAYLNALTGKGVHIVTVNDYLARRDAEWMGKVHRFLGLTVGVVVPGMDDAAKQQAYNCDITYATNNELGFDYLRDNLKTDLRRMVQRELAFAIVDEVDSILIDEARTPLIISGKGDKSSELYERVDRFVRTLEGGFDDDGNKGEEDTKDKKKKEAAEEEEGGDRIQVRRLRRHRQAAPSTAIGTTSSTAKSAPCRSPKRARPRRSASSTSTTSATSTTPTSTTTSSRRSRRTSSSTATRTTSSTTAKCSSSTSSPAAS